MTMLESNGYWPWLIISLGLLTGIVLILRHLSRTMDFSRAFFRRWKSRDDRGDDGGIWTSLDKEDHDDLDDEHKKLHSTPIPETALRADLPPGTTDHIEKKILPIETAAGQEPPRSSGDRPIRNEKNAH